MDGKRAENIFLSVLVALSKSQMVCALCIFVCNIYETENHSFDFAAMRGGVGVRHISAQSPKKGLRGGRDGGGCKSQISKLASKVGQRRSLSSQQEEGGAQEGAQSTVVVVARAVYCGGLTFKRCFLD